MVIIRRFGRSRSAINRCGTFFYFDLIEQCFFFVIIDKTDCVIIACIIGGFHHEIQADLALSVFPPDILVLNDVSKCSIPPVFKPGVMSIVVNSVVPSPACLNDLITFSVRLRNSKREDLLDCYTIVRRQHNIVSFSVEMLELNGFKLTVCVLAESCFAIPDLLECPDIQVVIRILENQHIPQFYCGSVRREIQGQCLGLLIPGFPFNTAAILLSADIVRSSTRFV